MRGPRVSPTLPLPEKSPDVLSYIMSLPRQEVDSLVHSITEILYSNGVTWNPDREWSAQEIELIAETLGESGVFRAVEYHDGEKVFP